MNEKELLDALGDVSIRLSHDDYLKAVDAAAHAISGRRFRCTDPYTGATTWNDRDLAFSALAAALPVLIIKDPQ